VDDRDITDAGGIDDEGDFAGPDDYPRVEILGDRERGLVALRMENREGYCLFALRPEAAVKAAQMILAVVHGLTGREFLVAAEDLAWTSGPLVEAAGVPDVGDGDGDRARRN
jgi:hypothetical protein